MVKLVLLVAVVLGFVSTLVFALNQIGLVEIINQEDGRALFVASIIGTTTLTIALLTVSRNSSI